MPAIVSGVNSNSQIFYSSYLSTYIERDVKELSDAIDSLKFLRFITAVAARCGQMVNVAEIAKDSDINQIQAKNYALYSVNSFEIEVKFMENKRISIVWNMCWLEITTFRIWSFPTRNALLGNMGGCTESI